MNYHFTKKFWLYLSKTRQTKIIYPKFHYNFRRRFALFVFTGFGFFAISAPEAMSRYGHAMAELKDGVPCFSIIDESIIFKNKYRVEGVTIEDPELRKKQDLPQISDDVWSFRFDSKDHQAKIKSGYCYKYGENPKYSVGGAPPKPLDLNHIYEIFIKAEPIGTTISTIGYGGIFCLVQGGEGAIVVLTSKLTRDARQAIELKCQIR